MSLELNRLVDAELDRKKVTQCREAMRNALLMGLSECRELMLGMEPSYQEKLLDDVTKCFHPDGNASDLFSDAFADSEYALDVRVDECARELKHPMAAE